MKVSEVRELSTEELHSEMDRLRRHLFDLRSQARIFIPTDLDPPSSPDQRIWQGLRTGYVEGAAEALRKILMR